MLEQLAQGHLPPGPGQVGQPGADRVVEGEPMLSYETQGHRSAERLAGARGPGVVGRFERAAGGDVGGAGAQDALSVAVAEHDDHAGRAVGSGDQFVEAALEGVVVGRGGRRGHEGAHAGGDQEGDEAERQGHGVSWGQWGRGTTRIRGPVGVRAGVCSIRPPPLFTSRGVAPRGVLCRNRMTRGSDLGGASPRRKERLGWTLTVPGTVSRPPREGCWTCCGSRRWFWTPADTSRCGAPRRSSCSATPPRRR